MTFFEMTTAAAFLAAEACVAQIQADSGNFMADGHYTDEGNMNFLIDAVCRWF